jgi:dynein heavy chain
MLNDSKPETLLDDIDLINTLESSKLTSEEIKLKIDESVILEQVIESTRNQYKSVSIRGSILFFVIKDLSIIDPMYQYSLQYIKRLFN